MYDTEIDYVCCADVNADKARALRRISEYEGRTYYFCAETCKRSFDCNPGKYAAKSTGANRSKYTPLSANS